MFLFLMAHQGIIGHSVSRKARSEQNLNQDQVLTNNGKNDMKIMATELIKMLNTQHYSCYKNEYV